VVNRMVNRLRTREMSPSHNRPRQSVAEHGGRTTGVVFGRRTDTLHIHQRVITLPGNAHVGLESVTTATPFTKTCSTPSEY